MSSEIYLDNNATTRPLQCVVQAMLACLTDDYGNPSSPYTRGRQARRAIEVARQDVAALLGCDAEEIIFTSGATEANNMILQGTIGSRQTVICTDAEHPSIREPINRNGTCMIIPVDHNGRIDLNALETTLEYYSRIMLPNKYCLIALHWANGETGALQPIKEICQLAREYRGITLFDASQAVGRMPTAEFDLPYDFLTFSAHKLHGPQGIGVLHAKNDARIVPLVFGGDQERGLRPGTENTPGIIGLGATCRKRHEHLDTCLDHLAILRNLLERELNDRIPGLVINGCNAPRIPNTSNITFPGIDAIALVARLDAAGVLCSQVSACSSARPEPSATLLAMGIPEEDAFSSLRFSVSTLNTKIEILKAVEIIAKEVKTLQNIYGTTNEATNEATNGTTDGATDGAISGETTGTTVEVISGATTETGMTTTAEEISGATTGSTTTAEEISGAIGAISGVTGTTVEETAGATTGVTGTTTGVTGTTTGVTGVIS